MHRDSSESGCCPSLNFKKVGIVGAGCLTAYTFQDDLPNFVKKGYNWVHQILFGHEYFPFDRKGRPKDPGGSHLVRNLTLGVLASGGIACAVHKPLRDKCTEGFTKLKAMIFGETKEEEKIDQKQLNQQKLEEQAKKDNDERKKKNDERNKIH